MLRQRNPQARAQAATHLDELDALGAKLRAAMMRAALRQYLDSDRSRTVRGRGTDGGVQSTTWCRWSSSESGSRCRRTRPWSCSGSRPDATACCRSTSARPRRRRSTTPSKGSTPPRPLTHDLFVQTLTELGVALEQIVVTEMRDHTYFAELHLRRGRGRRRPCCRAARPTPSPSPCACRRRCSPPRSCSTRSARSRRRSPRREAEEILDEFRDFIEHVNPDDFACELTPSGPFGPIRTADSSDALDARRRPRS